MYIQKIDNVLEIQFFLFLKCATFIVKVRATKNIGYDIMDIWYHDLLTKVYMRERYIWSLKTKNDFPLYDTKQNIIFSCHYTNYSLLECPELLLKIFYPMMLENHILAIRSRFICKKNVIHKTIKNCNP